MDWKSGRRSDNVEDRRGAGMATGAGGIGIGGLVVVLIGWMLGVDPATMLRFVQGTSQSAPTTQQSSPAPQNDEASQFLSTVLASTEDVWQPIFAEHGERYQNPTLVIFSGQVRSACGVSTSATGPFYCSGDQKLYIDPSFYNEMHKMGAAGDFAFAFVVAHEVGHHVQHLLGTLSKAHQYMRQVGKRQANQVSVRIELQADCYAGIWGNKLEQYSNIRLQAGDIEEGLRAAEAVGDDTLMQRAGGRVNPADFTHGSAADRKKWLDIGLKYGSLERCNTFK